MRLERLSVFNEFDADGKVIAFVPPSLQAVQFCALDRDDPFLLCEGWWDESQSWRWKRDLVVHLPEVDDEDLEELEEGEMLVEQGGVVGASPV